MDNLFLWCLYPPTEQQADISSNQQPVFSSLIHTVRILCLCDSLKRSALHFVAGADFIELIDWSVPVQWK